MMDPMRLVLDTSALLSALRSDRGASRQILLAAFERRVTLLLSFPLVLQYECALAPRQVREHLNWTPADVSAFIDSLVALSEPVTLTFLWRPCLKDPDDENALETAVTGGAEMLVTHKFKDFASQQTQFGITVATPVVARHVLAARERRPNRRLIS
jgi:putative PIN family toxin of toxin-antitoxin system